jgi:hypothetical protein
MGWGSLPDLAPKKKKRRGRGKVAAPMGPYEAQSSNKKIRSKASPAERRALSHGSSSAAKRSRKLARKDSRSAAATTTAVEKATASRPIETLRRAEAKLARTNDATLRESTQRLRHALASEALYKAGRKTPEGTPAKANEPNPWLKEVAPRSYEKAKSTAQAGGHGSSKGLGQPEDLTTAITVLAPGGGAVGALGKRAAEIGGKALAKDVLEAGAGKLESTAAKAELKGIKAGDAIKAGGRLAGNLARRVAGKETKKAGESAARIAAEKAIARGESRVAGASVPGLKLAKVGGGQAFPVVRGHEQALIHNPKKTLKTTARALPGLVTAPVGMAADVAITGGRAASTAAHDVGIPGAAGYTGKEILAPVKDIPAEQLAFAQQVAKVVTASDTKTVQKEVEDNLGLMLPIMVGLGSKAVADKFSKGRITEAVRKIAENTRARHGKAHGYRGTQAPRVLERTGQRKEAALAVAKGRTRLHGELRDRQQPMLEAARGATHSEVVRKGVLRGKRGKKLDLVIHDADVVSFLQRHPMKLNDPVAMLHEVRRIGERLKKPPAGMEPDPAKLTTRDVIAHIEKRPDVLSSPAVIAAVRSYREQGAYARKNHELAPEHSERARFLSAATTRDIPFPEEMYPKSVRDVVRASPQRGRLAKDVLRKEARHDRSRGRALRKKAAAAEGKAAIMRRELEIRERANKTRLGQGKNPKKVLRSVGADLPIRHERLRVAIDKLDRRAATAKEAAGKAEAMATRKHKAAAEVDTSLTPEFAGIVAKRLRDEGITELPEYQHAGPGRGHSAPVYGSSGSKLTQFPGKSKMRKGTAEEYGLVEEGLRPMIRESIARPIARRESYKAARQVMETQEFAPGGKREWSAKEADELFNGPDPMLSPEQWTKVPRQFYKRIYDVLEGKGKGKGITEQDFQMVGDLEAIRDSKGKAAIGSHYKIVRKAAMDELVDQLANTLVSPKIAKVNRATSFLILGTSPAWAAMQVIAEYGQAAVAQPKLLNPAFVRKAVKSYEAMDPAKRQAFDSWVGVTSRTIDKAEDLKLDLKSGDMDAAAKAYSTLEATPYGRFIRGIPTSIARVDTWKGGKIRALTTLAKIDHDLNSHVNTFIRGIGGVNKEMGAALKEMKGKSLKQQAEWVAEHPKWSHRYQSYLDDVMGNWSALTKNERVAAQAMIFYPFVRMSLRWTFYAFPKRHPIKAAMLYYLGQQNANELHKLLHGDPSYFTQWAMVPVDLGGEKKLIDLSRIAPGSNALIEALGGSSEGPKGIAAAKLAQPVLASLGTAIYGVSPLSGKQEPHSGWNALGQLLSLSPLARVAGEATFPSGRKKTEGAGQLPIVGGFSTERQEALDKLSGKLREYDSAARYVRQLAFPPLAKDVGKEADSALLGRVLKAFAENSSSARDDVTSSYATKMKNAVEEGKRHQLPAMKKEREAKLAEMEVEYGEASTQLDKLFDKYGIKHKKEDRLFLKFYDEGKYPSSSSSSSNPWGGSSSTETNPWSGEESSSPATKRLGSGGNPWGGS